MIKVNENLQIIRPKNQLNLFGYECYFNSFISLFQKNKLPNAILLSGPEGSGKATFVYHFVNYLLSYNEKNGYSVENFTINPDNKSYKNLCNNTHPNFSLLENDTFGEYIKIDNVRNTLKFLNKSTYSSNIKIVLIDSADYLNVYSSNALLKALEEANNKTFFFIINNNTYKILNTIKSRCIEFKFFFILSEKK
jgi:DNA polymerase-3 subunit delta'